MTDVDGRPLGVDVYPGNTADPTTVPDQVDKLRNDFGLERVVLVGDRGMLTQTQIDKLKNYPQLGWISALRARAVRGLVEAGDLQLSLFDEQNLAEITSPDYPGERLVVCFNPLLAHERRRKRQELLAATDEALGKIVAQVARRTTTPLLRDHIGLKLDTQRRRRDPVAPAEPSPSAKRKKNRRKTPDGLTVHSFETSLDALVTRCRNRCKTKTERTHYDFYQYTEPTPLQVRAYELLGVFPVR